MIFILRCHVLDTAVRFPGSDISQLFLLGEPFAPPKSPETQNTRGLNCPDVFETPRERVLFVFGQIEELNVFNSLHISLLVISKQTWFDILLNLFTWF